MRIAIGRATTVLFFVVAVLGALDWASGASRERARRAGGELVSLSRMREFEPAQAERLDLSIGDGREAWTYVKKDGAYRIPRYRDAYALSPNIEAMTKALMEGRGTRAASYPSAAERFGLESRAAMKLELRDRDGYLLLGALAGRVAPGERGDECYMAQEDEKDILLFNAIPWSSLTRTDDERLPPLIDTRVVPGALGRRSIAGIGVSPSPSGLTELIRKEVPPDPQSPEPEKTPRFEWYASFSPGDERRANDVAAGQYASFLGELAFDDLAGPASSERARVGLPILTLVLRYDEGASDTLALGARAPDGRHFLHSSATDQVFIVAPETAARLLPDIGALLAPPPKDDKRGG